MITKLNKIKENVAIILSKYPESRANDNYLFKTYLKMYYGIQLPEIESTVNFETLCRCRRYWQSQGKYKPLDNTVIESRHNAEKDYKETFSKKNNPAAKASGF